MSASDPGDARSEPALSRGDAIEFESGDPMQRCDSVLLIGFGGPTAPDEVRPFLDRVLQGRQVPRERYEAVVHHYELLGGRSPYNDLTLRQAAALREALRRDGFDLPVVVGMRNTPPFFDDALRDLAAQGARRVFRLRARGASMRSELGALPKRTRRGARTGRARRRRKSNMRRDGITIRTSSAPSPIAYAMRSLSCPRPIAHAPS